MSDIRREIVDACHRFVRETGLDPTRIYIGGAKWDDLRRECDSYLYRTFQPDPTKPPAFDGLDIYLTSDPDHLHVTR